MSKHLTIRISDVEADFLSKVAAEKGITRSAAARHLFLQNIALDQIKNEVRQTVQEELLDLNSQVQVLADFVSQLSTESVTKNDLQTAVNFVVERIKK